MPIEVAQIIYERPILYLIPPGPAEGEIKSTYAEKFKSIGSVTLSETTIKAYDPKGALMSIGGLPKYLDDVRQDVENFAKDYQKLWREARLFLPSDLYPKRRRFPEDYGSTLALLWNNADFEYFGSFVKRSAVFHRNTGRIFLHTLEKALEAFGIMKK